MWDVSTFFKTPGVGGALACSVIAILVTCYGLTIRWISKGHQKGPERR